MSAEACRHCGGRDLHEEPCNGAEWPIEIPECTCPWVDPKYWTTHYGAVEPGSQQEWDPTCPQHGKREDCTTCEARRVPVVNESEETLGVEEQAREVWVAYLDCGHQNVHPKPTTNNWGAFGA